MAQLSAKIPVFGHSPSPPVNGRMLEYWR